MDSARWLERFLQLRRFRKVKAWVNPPVLDIGGNNGELGQYLGLDDRDYVCTNDYRRLPADRFRTIVMLATLEHLDGMPDLSCGERIVVTTPAPESHVVLRLLSLGLDRANLNGHIRYYTKAGLTRCIDRDMIHYERFDWLNQLAVYE